MTRQDEPPQTKDAPLQAIAPLLVGVQTNPERDVSLEALAQEYGLSPAHFQRVFTDAVGESPRAHVERIRLERAAYRLSATDAQILDIALEVGFQSHETFARAFKRKFGKTPSAYRRDARAIQRDHLALDGWREADGCMLSATSYLTLKPMMCLAARRFGPYYDWSNLPPFGETNREFPRVLAHLESRGVAHRKLAIVIPYDNPQITPPHLQQADSCLPILEDAEGEGDIRRVDLPGGLYAAIEHRGPYDTLPQAYTAAAMDVVASPHHGLRGDPPIQIFREIAEDGDAMRNLTEVYFPVERVS